MEPGAAPTGSRRVLRRLRDMMAGLGTAQAKLDQVVRIIAAEMVAEVCSCYIMRAGEVLELFATEGLRPEAVRTLDEAVAVLQKNPTVHVEIEGHTCNIGTAEYNLALGERRANSVKDYLVSRGISADRFHTVSYGEERPKYDNSREETRRLNRRAALIVRLVQ